jgi:peptide/nickel transport system substrate-binding protein
MPEGAKLEVRQTATPFWLGLTMANAKLSDVRVRKAIQNAVDIDTIVEALFAGYAKRATGFVGPELLGYRDVAPPKRDVAAAKVLLEEAGVDGLTLQLDHFNTTEMMTAAQIVQSNLAEVGIEVVLNPMDEGTFWNLNYDVGADMEMHLVEWVGNPATSYFVKWFTPGDVWNWEYYESDEYVALLGEALGEADTGKRANMFQRLQEMLIDSGGFMFIAQKPTAVLYRDTIEPAMLPDGHPIFHLFKKTGS